MDDPADTSAPARLTKRRVILGVAVLIVVLGAFVGYHAVRAAAAATRAKNALLAAERDFNADNIDAARHNLDVALNEFNHVKSEVRGLGPLAPIGRQIPLLR